VASRDELWIASNAGCEKAPTVADATAPLAVENHGTVLMLAVRRHAIRRKSQLLTGYIERSRANAANSRTGAQQQRAPQSLLGRRRAWARKKRLNDGLGK